MGASRLMEAKLELSLVRSEYYLDPKCGKFQRMDGCSTGSRPTGRNDVLLVSNLWGDCRRKSRGKYICQAAH